MNEKLLRLALQRKGRLADKSLDLLKKAGIQIDNYSRRLLIKAQNFDLELLFVRDDDIPEYVQDGVADVGIVGENIVYETGKRIEIAEKLGFGKCRLSLALPKAEKFSSVKDLKGKKIATTYPNILKKYLEENEIDATINFISGSVEITPNVNLADAIFDIVDTGSTLISNGLKEAEVVLKSEAVLIANKDLSGGKRKLLDEILFRIRAVNKAKGTKYIMLNAPNRSIEKITDLLPGVKSPTVMPLALEGWSSIHTVISEEDFWERIGKLKNAGAQGILVLPIEKIIS